MKKIAMTLVVATCLMGSCGTYTGQGAYVGGSFGSILGSAIGGISGGWGGSNVGSIVGMAGGAAVGAAVGASADKKQAEKIEQYRRERERRYGRDAGLQGVDAVYENGDVREVQPVIDGSGFDVTNSADDRIDFDGAGPVGPVSTNSIAQTAATDNDFLEIRHVRISDADNDGVLRAGEECRISFEVMNRSAMTAYDVQPLVTEVTGNKRVHISPNLHVESIAPHSGIRYTATLLADKKLKDGTVVVRVGVAQGSREITSQVRDFAVQTRRK